MHARESRKRRLIVMFVLTFIYMIVELVVGYIGRSTTLLTDGFHMLSDVIALVIGFISIHLSPKKWEKSTFGWARMEVLGALVNAVFLIALCFTIVMESIQKIVAPERLQQVILVLVAGGGGLLLNLIGLCVFRETIKVERPSDSLAPRGSLIQNQNRLTRIIVPDIGTSTTTVVPSPAKETGSQRTFSFSTPVETNSSIESTPNAVKVEHASEGDKTAPSKTDIEKTPPAKTDIDKTTLPKFDIEAPPPPKFKMPLKKKGNVGLRSVFLHLLADTANSVIVMLAAGAAFAAEKWIGPNYDTTPRWRWILYLDPVFSIIIVCLMCLSTFPLLQETSLILLQTVPSHMSMKILTEELLAEVKGILGIHEFHVWQLTGDSFYASIHVMCTSLEDYKRISYGIKAFFNRRGIYETTIQVEVIDAEGNDSCYNTPSATELNPPSILKK